MIVAEYHCCFPRARGQANFDYDAEGPGTDETGPVIIGESTLASALRLLPIMVNGDAGWFRGADVDRSTHSPRRMKLWEVRDATDAIGCWVQTRGGGFDVTTEFRFFSADIRWSDEVLDKVDEAESGEFLGSRYASDWI